MKLVILVGENRSYCSACGFVQFQNPAPAVSVLVVDRDKVLLGKRAGHPGKGTWALPSGYLEYEEDFLTAAAREGREETGLQISLTAIINVTSSFVSPRYHFLGVYTLAHPVGGKLEAGDDLEVVVWHPLNTPLPEMGFVEDMHAIELFKHGYPSLPVEDVSINS